MSTVSALSPLNISHTIGRKETAGPGFIYPCALAINDRLNRIYVISRGHEERPERIRVTICNLAEDYLNQFGTNGHEGGQFIWPFGIAVDRDDNVWISDQWLNRISSFSKDGDFLGKWGTSGAGDGELKRPAGLAFDRDDNLLVVDGSNDRVQKFTKQGRFLAKWGSGGNGDGQFNLPWGIDIDRNGDVYVADWRNDRIQKFSREGAFLMKVGSSGERDGQFNRPTSVAVDQDGDIYVTDYGNNRLQMFDSRGNHRASFLGEASMSKWGELKLDGNPVTRKIREVADRPEREKLFYNPVGVVADARGRVLVLEQGRHRIQVYTKTQAGPTQGG